MKKGEIIDRRSSGVVLLVLLSLGGCSSEKYRADMYAAAARKIQNKDLAFFPDAEFIHVFYDTTEENKFVKLVRCVRRKNQLLYPVMLVRLPSFSGPNGNVEASTGFDRLFTITFARSKLFSGRELLPRDKEIEKYLYFVHGEGTRGDGVDPNAKWRYFELDKFPEGDVIIPSISQLPLVEGNKDMESLLSRFHDAELDLQAAVPDKKTE